MPKVSICVPVYNVERYIGPCIESIQNQTLQDIEIIIVNDCTPDNSMQIVHEYAAKDSRIKVIEHDINHGLMWARRTGYMAATGDYITFCDSDDTLPENAVECLYNLAGNEKADISAGNLTYIDVKGNRRIMSQSLLYGTDKISIYRSLLKHEMGHNLCSKMFKRELLQEYEYNTYEHFTNGEDGCLFYQVVDNCIKMAFIDKSVYNYYQNTESSSQVRLKEKGIASIMLLNKIRVMTAGKYDELHALTWQCVSTILNGLINQRYGTPVRRYASQEGMTEYISLSEMLKYLPLEKVIRIYVGRIIGK